VDRRKPFMPVINLDLQDATELAEMLEFINAWLTSDRDRLNASLHRFVADPHPSSYDIHHLHHDLRRFAFLLGGDEDDFLNPPPA
jgi:hypothetical protein